MEWMDFDKRYIIRFVYPSSAFRSGLIRLIYLKRRVHGEYSSLPPLPSIHPSRKRDRVTWFSAKLAFDSLSKLFHCCRIHEHPCGLSPPSYFFFLFLVYSVEIDLPLPIKRARRLEKGGGAVEQGGEMTEVEGIFRKLRDVKLL